MLLRLLFRLLLAAAALSLAACDYIPRPVMGVPPGVPWEALPLRKWLAEDRAEPVAMAFCAPPECRPGLAIGVIRLVGRDADVTEALLKNPERLARALEMPREDGKPVKTRISVEPLAHPAYPGFLIALAALESEKPPAYGAALGRREGDGLTVVLVIGEAADAVRDVAQRVAERELGS